MAGTTKKTAAKKAAKPAAPKGTRIEVEGGTAFISEGAGHQRRNAARDLAAKLNAYADAVVL